MAMASTTPGSPVKHPASQGGLFEGVTGYHWLVVIIASLGWLFDCMDQRLFILAREAALRELLAGRLVNVDIEVKSYIGTATTWLILGWATGGILFGMMSDKYGRVKTMVVTLLVYSGFTGLSGVATSFFQFTAYRFMVGLGVGGMFGAAAALVAESVPARSRAQALGLLQALSTVGNMAGSLISMRLAPGAEISIFGHAIAGWRALFFVGVLPALLVVPIVFVLREPEPWKRAKEAAKGGEQHKQMGTIRDLFRDPRWRHRTLIGLAFGVAGMVGLWGIGFYSPELVRTALAAEPQAVRDWVASLGTFLQDAGAFCGIMFFTLLATYLGRRFAFLTSFILGMGVVAFVFYSLRSASDAYWMLPLVGFVTLMPFGGYSIYFPELYPTRLRGVGVGFCYNTGRYLIAPAPLIVGRLTGYLNATGIQEPFRLAAVIMTSVYLVGMVAVIWAPETKGQPLPEDH